MTVKDVVVFGENVPVPLLDHTNVVAPPPIKPLRAAVALFGMISQQIAWLLPANAVAAGFIVTRMFSPLLEQAFALVI